MEGTNTNTKFWEDGKKFPKCNEFINQTLQYVKDVFAGKINNDKSTAEDFSRDSYYFTEGNWVIYQIEECIKNNTSPKTMYEYFCDELISLHILDSKRKQKFMKEIEKIYLAMLEFEAVLKDPKYENLGKFLKQNFVSRLSEMGIYEWRRGERMRGCHDNIFCSLDTHYELGKLLEKNK